MTSEPQSPASLEAQLRSMILNNVKIPGAQTTHDPPHQQQNQRGRGNWNRGRGRGGGPRRDQPQHPNAPAGTPASPGLRQGHANPPPHRGNRNRQSQPKIEAPAQFPTHLIHQHGAAAGSQTQSTTKGRDFPPRPSRQAHQHGPHPGPTSTGNAHIPKILPRPHYPSGPRNMPPGSPSPQHMPRNYGFPMQQHYMHQPAENPLAQIEHLERLSAQEIPKVEMSRAELEDKEAFRLYLEGVCKKALAENYSGDIATIALVSFGSLASGFATPGSDMDLAIVPTWKDPARAHETEIDRDIPRLLETALLDEKFGARLLTRTRVPILKICQEPSEELYTALFDERKKWDELPEDEQYPQPLPPPELDPQGRPILKPLPGGEKKPKGSSEAKKKKKSNGSKSEGPEKEGSQTPTIASQDTNGSKDTNKEQRPHHEKAWAREKVLGPLDFPKQGVGIQCDINFENPLGIHNTHLLRCYSLCDPRVRPMVLFVKSWAKRRKINSSYSGTLSSYGWVLMVLHYLVNIAQPPVCPNLQLCSPPQTDPGGIEQITNEILIQGYPVRFWRNESEIIQAQLMGQLSQNTQSIGALLRGFFQYFASLGGGYHGPRVPSFHWTNEVLSLRTQGGLRTKFDKGWTGAKTTISNGREVRHRYLFSIEDPFELDHNVARTVTHNGIVAIRDEFRRAWRILSAVGRDAQLIEGDIFDEVVEKPPPSPNSGLVVDEGKQDGNATDKKGMEIRIDF